jgi:hypothetical protein
MKPKKPNFDPSSLPSGKGISPKPAKIMDAAPNFVKRGQQDKTGTNPNNPNVPKILYQPFMKGTPKQSVEYQKVSKTGKMRDADCKEGDRSKCEPTSIPVKNEQLSTIMDKSNKNLKIGNAKKVEKYIK